MYVCTRAGARRYQFMPRRCRTRDDATRESLNPNRALSIPARDIKDHYARYRFCDPRDVGSLSIRSGIQKRRNRSRHAYTRAHTRAQAVPFNIPVAGGEPITLALKYGNRATGSAYRRLDKRCDARSIGPPTDREARPRSRARARLSSSFCFSRSPSASPPLALTVSPQSFVMYVTRS